MAEIIRKRPSSASFGNGPNSKLSSSSIPSSSANKRRKPQILKSKVLNPIDPVTGLSKCFHTVKTSLYVSLAPSYVSKPMEGIKAQHLDNLIMAYYPPVNGVIIGYSNVKLSNEDNANDDDEDGEKNHVLATINAHTPFAFLWITVEFLVWKPLIGDIAEGYIYMQSPSHIGLLINDTFNASIKKFNIPSDWQFIPSQVDETQYDDNDDNSNGNNNGNGNNDDDDDTLQKNKKSSTTLGQWVNEDQMPIDGKLTFTIRAIHNTGRVVSVEGSLLTPGKEFDSLPVVPNTKSINKKIKFTNEDNGNSDTEITATAVSTFGSTVEADDDGELPCYDQNDSDSDSDSDQNSNGDSSNRGGAEDVIAEVSSSEASSSDDD